MLSRRLCCIVLQFLSVRKNDERPVVALAFSEGIVGRLNRFGKVGSTTGNDLRVEFRDRIAGRCKIRCQRRLQKRRSRKRNNAHPVALNLTEQILRRELRTLQTARLQVCGQHRARCVDCNHHVAPHLTPLLP